MPNFIVYKGMNAYTQTYAFFKLIEKAPNTRVNKRRSSLFSVTPPIPNKKAT